MSLYCRITGKSRGLPKPNYFPLLPPISPADAKKLCRITGKTHGLPTSHHYVPVPLIPKKKTPNICPVTGKAIGQPQHHFIPELPANAAELRHQPISGYRYVVPVLDNPPPPLLDLLNSDVLPDAVEAQYVYTLEEQKCSIVIPANIEAAVRHGKVSSILMSDNNEKVALKFLEGKQVTVKVIDMQPPPSFDVNNLTKEEASKDVKTKKKSTAKKGKTAPPTEISPTSVTVEKAELAPAVPASPTVTPTPAPATAESSPVTPATAAPTSPATNITAPVAKPPITSELNKIEPATPAPATTLQILPQPAANLPVASKQENPASKISGPVTPILPAPTPEGPKIEIQVAPLQVQETAVEKPVNEAPSQLPLLLLDGQGPSQKALEKKKKVAEAKAKKKENEVDMKKIFEDKEIKAEKAELASIFEKKPKPVKEVEPIPTIPEVIPLVNGEVKELPETKPPAEIVQVKINKTNGSIFHPQIVSWDDLSKVEINSEERVTPLPDPIIIPQSAQISIASCEPGVVKPPTGAMLRATISLPPATGLVPALPSRNIDTSILKSVWDVAKRDQEILEKTANAIKVLSPKHLDKVATLQDILKVTKNLEKGTETELKWGSDILHGKNVEIHKDKSCFVPGLIVNGNFIPGQTIDNQFVAGLTVKTANKIGLIPGCVIKEDGFVAGINKEGKFIPGQIIKNGKKEEFVPGQTIKTPEGFKFVAGQEVDGKFVPGLIIDTPQGPQFVQGQSPSAGEFRPGQICYKSENGEPIFVSGQNVDENGEVKFVPGKTLQTPQGPKFVPGRDVENGTFVPGLTENNKFIPGTVVPTPNGEQFVEGRVIESPDGKTRFVPGSSENNGFTAAKQVKDLKTRPYKEKKVPYQQEVLRSVVYGHMLQMDSGVQFYPEGNTLPTVGVTRSIPGQLVKNAEDEEEPRFIPGMMIDGLFIAGQMVRTMEGTKFVPGQLVRTKDGAKFVPGQTLDDGQFVPGQVVDDKFVPGQIIQTAAGPTFIPGQVISTPEEGARFVPGRVVETSEGPRFAPGRVVEDANGGVAFIPGRVVETGDGPHFIAPDLESTADGNIQFSMQSFEVSPEELQLIDQTNINMEESGNIDSKMLDQLAKAGITLAQKNLPDVYVCPVKNLQEIATHITERLKLPEEAQEKMAVVLQKVAELGHNISNNKSSKQNSDISKPNIQSEMQLQAYELIESAITFAVTTASKDVSLNPDEVIIQEMSSVLEDALPNNNSTGQPYADILLTALFEIVTSDATLEAITTSVQQGLKRPVASKVEVLKDLVNKAENVQETVAKISSVLRKPKNTLDIGKAFKRLSAGDPELVDLVVSKVGQQVDGVETEKQAAHTLQNSIVSAVRESSERQIYEILDSTDQSGLKHLILQAVGLARALGLNAAAEELLHLVKDSRIASALATDQTALEILQRLTLMKKLSESRPAYAQALGNLDKNSQKEDTRYLKQLVRESEALLTSVKEEEDSYISDDDDDYSYSTSSFNSTFDDEIIGRVPRRISSSNDIPAALFHALVDCQKQPILLKRLLRAAEPDRHYNYDHACVIIKNKTQAVIPKESSKSVLTGKASYTLIDDKGVQRFDALDVFSALKIDKPIALKKFSLYSAGLESTWGYAKELPPEMDDDTSSYIAPSTVMSYVDTPDTQGSITPVSSMTSYADTQGTVTPPVTQGTITPDSRSLSEDTLNATEQVIPVKKITKKKTKAL